MQQKQIQFFFVSVSPDGNIDAHIVTTIIDKHMK